MGHTTIVDCVNPWAITREIFTDAAKRSKTRFIGVETVCSDPVMHRARVEERKMDVPSLKMPDWRQVLSRDYTPWAAANVKLDTAKLSIAEAVSEIEKHL